MLDVKINSEFEERAEQIADDFNEPLEEMETETPGFFDNIDNEEIDEDPFESDKEAISEENSEAILMGVEAFSEILAGMLSAMTGKPTERYLPAEKQQKKLANAINKVLPRLEISPGWNLIFAVLSAYLPVGYTAFIDYKEKKNAESKINYTIRDQWNGQNDSPETDTQQN